MIVLPTLAGIAVLGVVGTVAVRRFLAPPQTPPAYTGPRPEPAEDGYLSHTESIRVDAPTDTFRRWVNHTDLSELLVESRNLPRVARTEAVGGTFDPDQDRTGARRRVVLEDGHFSAEEVLVDTPEVFRYIVWGYTNYARLMIEHAIGEFHFHDEEGKTRLTWTYSFRPRSALVRPFLSRFVNGTWADLMRKTLQAMREGGERQALENADRHQHQEQS
jgi:Polyketide cyclase / dehydrase and lipid transport